MKMGLNWKMLTGIDIYKYCSSGNRAIYAELSFRNLNFKNLDKTYIYINF